MKTYKIPKNKRFKSKFTIKIDFECKTDKKARKELIKEITKLLNKKRVTVKKQDDYSMTIVTRVKRFYFPATTNSIKGDLMYHANTNQYNFFVEAGINRAIYTWKPKHYKIYYTERRIEEHVVYITANSEDEARDMFWEGEYEYGDHVDTYDIDPEEIVSIEEDR